MKSRDPEGQVHKAIDCPFKSTSRDPI